MYQADWCIQRKVTVTDVDKVLLISTFTKSSIRLCELCPSKET